MIFYHISELMSATLIISELMLAKLIISELMLPTLIQRYDKKKKQQKKNISFKERGTNWNFTGCQVPHFRIILMPYINLLKLSWIIKCLFLRDMEPLETSNYV